MTQRGMTRMKKIKRGSRATLIKCLSMTVEEAMVEEAIKEKEKTLR